MKAASTKVTIEALKALAPQQVIEDDANPDRVGLLLGGQVLWVMLRGAALIDPYVSKAIVRRHARIHGELPVPEPVKMPTMNVFSPDFEVKEFCADDAIDASPAPDMEFDMGPGTLGDRVKKVLGTDDEPELPSWLQGVTGEVETASTGREWE
jgi:hypothetical protein